MSKIKDMKYYSEDIGKIIKSFTHEFRWEFTIDETKVCIQMFSYFISNTRRVLYNQEELINEHGGPNNTYNYEFEKEGHQYKITQSENVTLLYIDGITFDYNHSLEKNKKEFEGNNNQTINVHRKSHDISIKPSCEVIFMKREKQQKQIINFSIKNKINNNAKKENNLDKFKFNSGENVQIKINKKTRNKNGSKCRINGAFTNKTNNNNNLIDFDNDKDFKNNYNTNNDNKFNLIDDENFNFKTVDNGMKFNSLGILKSSKNRAKSIENIDFNSYGF